MRPLTLTGLRVWDGVTDDWLDGVDAVRIEGRRITDLGEACDLTAGATVRSFDGAHLVPGLIDAHVHLTLDPEIRSAADQVAQPHDAVQAGMESRAAAMLRSGITTARDLGGGAWLEIGLRDRIRRGEPLGPRLLCAGQPVTSAGGHCHFWGGEAKSEGEVRAVVRRQVERGADLIKVMATGGVLTKGTSIREAQFEPAELGWVVDEASRHGRRVAAHCHATVGIRNAALARVATVEHCSWAGEHGFGSDVDPEVARELAAGAVSVSPTVNAGWRRFLEGGERGEKFLAGMREGFSALREAGVRLIASTDAGIPGVFHDQLPKALPVLAHYAELSPVETLRAATSDAAAALELGGTTGAIRAGLEADLLLVDGDPLHDLAALESPVAVFAAGREVAEA